MNLKNKTNTKPKTLVISWTPTYVSTLMFHAHSNRSKYFRILSQYTTQAQHIGWSIWIVIIKTLHINWVNNFPLSDNDKPNDRKSSRTIKSETVQKYISAKTFIHPHTREKNKS